MCLIDSFRGIRRTRGENGILSRRDELGQKLLILRSAKHEIERHPIRAVTDHLGRSVTASATVTVTHDQGKH